MQALRPSPQFVTDDGAEQFLETVQGDDSLCNVSDCSPLATLRTVAKDA